MLERAILMGFILATGLNSFAEINYKLRFTEEFKGKDLNTKLWERIPAGHPDWCKNMSMRKDLVKVKFYDLYENGKKISSFGKPKQK